MSFTNQKPFEVTEKDVVAFTRHKKKFCCALCGHEFQQGDVARWVHTNSTQGLYCGNFFVCKEDDVDVLNRAKASFEQAAALAKQWGIYGPDWQ